MSLYLGLSPLLSKDRSVRKEKKMKHVCTICGYVYDEEKEKVLLKTFPIPGLVRYVETLSRPLFL